MLSAGWWIAALFQVQISSHVSTFRPKLSAEEFTASKVQLRLPFA
jgi:hypothetical protein